MSQRCEECLREIEDGSAHIQMGHLFCEACYQRLAVQSVTAVRQPSAIGRGCNASIHNELVDAVGRKCALSRHTLIILPDADLEVVAVEEDRLVLQHASGQKRHIPISEIWKVVTRWRLPGNPVLGLVLGVLGLLLPAERVLSMIVPVYWRTARFLGAIGLLLLLGGSGLVLSAQALKRPRRGVAIAGVVVSGLAVLWAVLGLVLELV